MATTVKTDTRLLALIDGGNILRSLIDPDGISLGGKVEAVVADTANQRWKMRLSFTGGKTLWIQGVRDGENLWIEKLRMPQEEKGTENIPCERAKTLLESLGNLDGVPARLRRVLVSPGRENGSTDEKAGTFLAGYVALIDEALTWDVEPRDEKRPMSRFNVRRINYNESKAEFSAICDLQEGRIILSADANVYGLGNKKVVLEKNLGMLRNAVVECCEKREGRSRPSVRAAFDLYDTIPVLYGMERVQKKDTGIPRAKKKSPTENKVTYPAGRKPGEERAANETKVRLHEEYVRAQNNKPRRK